MKRDNMFFFVFFSQTEVLEIIPPTLTALSTTFCVQRTSFRGLKICKRSEDFRIPKHGLWQGGRHVKHASSGLAKPLAAGKHDDDSE